MYIHFELKYNVRILMKVKIKVENNMTFLTITVSIREKLMILGGVLLFSCLLYLVLPKMMNNKIKGYHEQCEQDEEEVRSEDNTVEK